MTNLESVSSSLFCLWEAQAESLLWAVLVACAESGFYPKGVLSVSAKSWAFQGSIPDPVAANLFQVSGPKIAILWEEKLSQQCQLARVAGSMGKALLGDSHACVVEAMQEAPVRWVQPDRSGSSGRGCILVAADFENWSERSLFSQTRSNCLHQSCANGSCHLNPARMHCSCSYHEHKTGKTTAN